MDDPSELIPIRAEAASIYLEYYNYLDVLFAYKLIYISYMYVWEFWNNVQYMVFIKISVT